MAVGRLGRRLSPDPFANYPLSSPSSDKSIYSQENIPVPTNLPLSEPHWSSPNKKSITLTIQFWQIYFYQTHIYPVPTKYPSPWQSSSDKFTFLSDPKPWVLFCHWLTDHRIYHSRGMDFPIPPFWFCFEIGITESTSTTIRSKAITSIIQQRPLWIWWKKEIDIFTHTKSAATVFALSVCLNAVYLNHSVCSFCLYCLSWQTWNLSQESLSNSILFCSGAFCAI